MIDAAGERVGLAICKDMHIPSIGREYGGAEMMAVPAWDFGHDGWMGARMTAMRGVENGYAIARSAREGLLGAYDSVGRAIVERATSERAMVLTASLPIGGQAHPTRTSGGWHAAEMNERPKWESWKRAANGRLWV